jgi:hypothetical protein
MFANGDNDTDKEKNSIQAKEWNATVNGARFEYRRQIGVFVFAIILFLGCIPWGWFGAGWVGIGYLALGWFLAFLVFELTSIKREKNGKIIAIVLVICIFVGVFVWGYINEPVVLTFFSLLVTTFVIHAERWRREKKHTYQKLSAWNKT